MNLTQMTIISTSVGKTPLEEKTRKLSCFFNNPTDVGSLSAGSSGGNEGNGELFQRSHACAVTLTAPNPAAGHHLPTPLLETLGHSQASLDQSFVGSLLLSPGSWFAQSFVCALLESVSLVLCKFWWLCGGVIGDLLQEGLCHTQVCCTQSPCPCSRPLLTWTCRRHSNTQRQIWLSLCRVLWWSRGFV